MRLFSLLPFLFFSLSCGDTFLSPLETGCEDRADLIGRSCSTDVGECSKGEVICRGGGLYCLGGVFPQPEVCDSLDNNCSGRVDDLPYEGFCYDGPPGTAIHGICRPGLLTCVAGNWECLGQKLPLPEISCNKIDESCDGVDFIPTSTTVLDVSIAFIFDRSVSMGRFVNNARIASASFVFSREADLRFEWFYIDLPGPEGYNPRPNDICHPLPDQRPVGPCNARTLQQALAMLDASYGGVEFSYDAMYNITQMLRLGPGRRHLFFFGDEIGQTADGLSQDVVAQRLKELEIEFHGFVSWNVSDSYQKIADVTGGSLDSLSASTADMFNAMDLQVPTLEDCGE